MGIPYNPSIPATNDDPADDQPLMQQNFSSISSLINVDHVGFANPSYGEHNQVTFATTNVPSTPTNPVSILYTKNDASSIPQINFINSQAFPLTASGNGSVLIFGGIIIQWGSTGAVSDNASISFANAFKNNCYNVQLTIVDPNATSKTINVKSGTLSTSGFSVRVSSGSVSAYYLAIGN